MTQATLFTFEENTFEGTATLVNVGNRAAQAPAVMQNSEPAQQPSKQLSYTHGFFPYPAKFPSEPVREFLLKYSKPGDRVLDPFCGSGTVLVESILHSRHACGLELNPVAALVAAAKATLYPAYVLDELCKVDLLLTKAQDDPKKWVEEILKDGDVPNYKNVTHWFQPTVLCELAALRKAVCESKQWSHAARQLLWMAFLKNIVPLSNQDTETRYAAVSKPPMPVGFAINKLQGTLISYRRALTEALPHIRDLDVSANVHEGDTLKLLPELPHGSFDLAITSPPYINTFDYYLYHKHRIFWMGRDPREIRRQEVGCHHRVDTMTYEVAVSEYRLYLENVLRGIYPALKTGSRFVMLIGDGIVKKHMVLADELMCELAAVTGFEVERIDSLSLREVSRRFIKDERLDRKKHHIIVLRK